jgi:predicted nucleic acid-binding protein
MSSAAAFWDASALVLLCIRQSSTPEVRAYLRKFAPVVWWASTVEVHSAISRLHRTGLIGDAGQQGAFTRLLALQRSWKEILPDDRVRDLAGQLLDTYPLRTADSLQLAAALTWCQQRPNQRHFISGDERLSNAAESAGFSIKRLGSALSLP